MTPLTIICACGSAQKRPFLRKLDGVLQQRALPYELWGWEREKGRLPQITHGTRILLRGGGDANARLGWRYIAWMLCVFRAVATSEWRHERRIWMCCDLVAALPTMLATRFRGERVVFFNLDNVALRYRWPTLIRAWMTRIEESVGNRARVHVLPQRDRWNGHTGNLHLVRNSPTTAQIRAARSIATQKRYERPHDTFVAYVNGWLTSTRGLGMILRCARLLKGTPFTFVVAGQVLCNEAEELIKCCNVEYLGELSSEEALAHYSRCHVCLTFYDPEIPINRLAAPNKWEDCAIMGVPFVANSEIETLKTYVARGACEVVPYDDHCSLAVTLRAMARDRDRWTRMREAVARMAAAPFDVQLAQVLDVALMQSGDETDENRRAASHGSLVRRQDTRLGVGRNETRGSSRDL